MRAKKLWIIGSIVLIFLVGIIFLPVKTVVKCIGAEQIGTTPYADSCKELQSQHTTNSPVVYGDLWIIEGTTLLGRKQETYIMPCIYFAPGDVGTAGTTTWTTRLELLSNGNIQANNIEAQITSDTNTGLHFPGFTDSYANRVSPEIMQEDNTYSASVSASTVDSSIEVNKDCSAQASWTAVVSIPGRGISCQVNIHCEAAYYNNVK